MKKKLLSTTLMLVAPMLYQTPALAQGDPEQPNVAAVEIYQCSYAKGKGPKDLDKVVSNWNSWADKNYSAPYSAWTLSPVSTGSYFDADIGWLGAFQNGVDMGKVTQEWLEKGGKLQAEFDSVIPCDTHGIFSSVNYKPPADKNWPGKNGSTSVTVFSDCTVAEGKTLTDIDAMNKAWAKHLTARGSKAGFWMFLPAFGIDNLNGHYKVVMGYPSFEEWGKDHNDYTNGGGWRKGMELMQGVVSCDSPRVYATKLQRNGGVSAN